MRNVLERGMIMARGESAIAPYHLPVEVREARSIERRSKPRRLIDGEREQIVRMLQYHRGNRTRTARDLGVSRVTLLKKIRKYGLQEALCGCKL
jgi:two-component system NtrC family response regulator